ncbi:hypothetical protein OC845_006925, partial [Tilletia horrida]
MTCHYKHTLTPLFTSFTSNTLPTSGGATPVPTQSPSNPPYQPHVVSEKDNNGQPSQYSYQSITFLPSYRGISLEELRVQDYQQGRKTGTAGPSAGGAFAQLGPPGTPGGLFGQAGQQGAAAASPIPFGQQAKNLFRTQPAAGEQSRHKDSLFSNTATSPTAATGGVGFGATSGAAATQTKPAFSFGNAAASTSAPNAFGSNMNAAGQPAAGGGLFGTSTAGFSAGTTTATPAISGGIFGAGTSFGAKPATGGLFGSNQVQSAGATGGSLFGASTAAPTSGGLFDSKPATGQTGGLFGSTTYGAQGPAAAGPNAFGTSGGGLFGSNAQAKPGGLSEAGGNAGEGLFGNRNHAGTGASGPFGTGPTGADVAASGGQWFGAVTLSASQNAGAVSSPFRPTPRSSGKTLRY